MRARAPTVIYNGFMPGRKVVIKIKKEDRPKRRSGVKPTRPHAPKTGYRRKPKHAKREER